MRELWAADLICKHRMYLWDAGVRELRKTVLLQMHCQDGLCKEARLRQVRSDDEEIGEPSVLLIPGTVQSQQRCTDSGRREARLLQTGRPVGPERVHHSDDTAHVNKVGRSPICKKPGACDNGGVLILLRDSSSRVSGRCSRAMG